VAKKESKNITVADCLKNLRYANRKNSKLFEKFKEDFEASLGRQWKKEDEETLRKAGVEPLTINKIKPIIKILTGIERQSRSDIVAFPEGQEDSIKAEIATKLIKCVMKKSNGVNKLSSQFKSGITGGMCYLEPYIDYLFDLINGNMKFKKVSGPRILFDPDAEEYDLSDAKYVIKISRRLTREQLVELFPSKEKVIDDIEHNRFVFDTDGSLTTIQYLDYPEHEGMDDADEDERHDGDFDLAEYYYKGKIKKYYAASKVEGTLIEVETREEADAYVATLPDAQVIEKEIPEIRRKAFVGSTELDDDVAWSYPKWKGYPFIPFFSEWNNEDGVDRELLVQGLVRSIRSLQFEYNKRRTQELRHLNSTVGAIFMAPKGALDNPTLDKLSKYGSTPGFVGEYNIDKAGGTSPQGWRLNPAPLSQGHAQLAAENAQDIKEASGVNTDLLANDSKSDSGKAILLKQRQGLVMVQEPLDNYGETKKILGRFILSQLGELFTVETAVKVLGEAWIGKQDAFKEPVLDENEQPQLGQNGKLVLELNPGLVGEVINEVLNDSSLGKYDVTIGEGAYTETTRMANHAMLMEMASGGIPIPPSILIQESSLPESSKSQIITALEAQAQAAQAQVQPQ